LLLRHLVIGVDAQGDLVGIQRILIVFGLLIRIAEVVPSHHIVWSKIHRTLVPVKKK